MVLDPKTKAAWCDALRSKKYKQGRHYIRGIDDYCCLGVLADVCGEEFVPVVGDDETDILLYTVRGNAKLYFGPNNELERAQAKELAERNDNGASFDEIADFIEKEL